MCVYVHTQKDFNLKTKLINAIKSPNIEQFYKSVIKKYL